MSDFFDCIYGIVIAIAGLFFVVTPYEKLKEKFPKAPSSGVVKVLGVVVLICGIAMIALAAVGIM